MSSANSARAIIAEMELGHEPPIAAADLTREWRYFAREAEEGDIAQLRRFLDGFIGGMLAKVKPQAILGPLAEAVDILMREPELTIRELVFAVEKAFDIDPCDVMQIREVHTQVYERMDSARIDRARVSEALVIVRRAEAWLESTELAVTGFMGDRDVSPDAFKTMADRERFAKSVLTDVAIHQILFERRRGELMLLDSRFSRNYETCDRALATMKLFSDIDGKRTMTTGRIARGPVPIGRPVGGATFAGGGTFTRHVPGG